MDLSIEKLLQQGIAAHKAANSQKAYKELKVFPKIITIKVY